MEGCPARWQRLSYAHLPSVCSLKQKALAWASYLLYEFWTENTQTGQKPSSSWHPHNDSILHINFLWFHGPQKALSNFLFPEIHGVQLCVLPGKSHLNVRGQVGRWGPRCLLATGPGKQLPANTLRFRCGASLCLFSRWLNYSCLICPLPWNNLFWMHLETRVSAVCLGWFLFVEKESLPVSSRETEGPQKSRCPWLPVVYILAVVSENQESSQKAPVPLGSSLWNVGGHPAQSVVFIDKSQFSENVLAKRDQEAHCKHKGQWQANNYWACW